MRDLAPVGDELPILAGPVGDDAGDHTADNAYRLFRWTPQTDALIRIDWIKNVATHDGDKPDKPEAIQPLGIASVKIEVLVLSDGPELGAPKSYEVDWAE